MTHEIVVYREPIKPVSGKMEYRRRQRLKQDLRNHQIKIGDTVIWCDHCVGQVIEIIYNYSDIPEWDGTKPLNIVVSDYSTGEEFYTNIFDLEKL
ncbi:MAG TPA: hypothetical protein VFM18_01580 [Methanosarcina sp.]|nr:hypothetical protein [Methanosarcina sp.]